ncbi:host-nuclease inhibitor Gam family protein [Bartonella sp. HY761]|uniref:host-nuclease inhibitor Gam family protein n=1 Tax=Bartonella sp. HY761 TaxID=2979330 RepID=UPI0022007757|nr:host-nuclease inhibitor Gam family protein [Bartonella sp. HY761]UXN07537.1 host-nuclease inhibitor Gam family protein [Bartonella sp. HY761]
MARKTKKAAMVCVPQNRDEVVKHIGRIGFLQGQITIARANHDERVRAIGEQLEEATTPFAEELKSLEAGVQAFCEANRNDLTSGGKVKFHDFGTGRVNWRLRPQSVSLRNTVAVIEACKALELAKFIRTKEEINKEAMLADPEKASKIAGVTIKSEGEDFVIEPVELQTSQKGAA